MICFCDFNPRVIKKYELNEFNCSSTNRAQNVEKTIGNSGVNSVMLLKKLGENSKLLTCLGLENGKIIRETLESLKIETDIVKLLDESVESIEINSKKSDEENFVDFTVVTKSPRITSATESEILSRINKISNESGVLVLNETDTENLEQDFFENIARIASNNEKIMMSSFKDEVMIKNTPIKAIVVDKEQLFSLTGEVVKIDSEILRVLKNKEDLYEMIVVVGRASAIYRDKENAYKIFMDEKKVESLDKNLFLTGLGLGLEKKYNLDTTLKLAFSLSAFKNFKSEIEVEMSDIKEIMNKVKLRRTN